MSTRTARRPAALAILAGALCVTSRTVGLEAAAIREEVFAIASGWNLIHLS